MFAAGETVDLAEWIIDDTCLVWSIFFQVNQLKDFQTRWFRIEPWRKWCQNLIYLITEGEFHSLLYDIDSGSGAAVDDLGESPAYEVIKFRDKDGYFAR